MWIKNLDEISQYIPKDSKFHNVQIVNNCLWIDGKSKIISCPFSGHIDDFHTFNKALTKEEIRKINEKI